MPLQDQPVSACTAVPHSPVAGATNGTATSAAPFAVRSDSGRASNSRPLQVTLTISDDSTGVLESLGFLRSRVARTATSDYYAVKLLASGPTPLAHRAALHSPHAEPTETRCASPFALGAVRPGFQYYAAAFASRSLTVREPRGTQVQRRPGAPLRSPTARRSCRARQSPQLCFDRP